MGRFTPHAIVIGTLALLTSPAAATTYYIAPDGSDSAPGTSIHASLDTFEHAIRMLKPGDTLVLLDGRYTVENSGRFFARGGHNAADGAAGKPITIKARNERRAHIDGDGRYAFRFQGLSGWRIEGIQCSSADRDEGVARGDIFLMTDCENMVVRRVLAHHNNRHENSGGFSITNCRNVLVEECELYYFHRNGFSAFGSDGITFRRCYANSRGHPDIPGGRGSHSISRDGGDASFTAYYSSNVIFENCISEYKNEGFSAIAGKDTVAGRPSGDNIRFLGCVSMDDHRNLSLQSRDKGDGVQAIRNCVVRDFVAIRPFRRGILTRAVRDLTMENVTVIDGTVPAFSANLERQEVGRTIWPSTEAVDGSTFRFRNWLIINTEQALAGVPENGPHLDFRLLHANFDNTPVGKREDIGDDSGQVRHSTAVRATRMGTGRDEHMIRVPPSSNMSGAGASGADIGANIVYRYMDGERTDTPLWTGSGGSFPHGATVEINDNPGESLFDVHERLNVHALPTR